MVRPSQSITSEVSKSLWSDSWQRLGRNKLAIFSAILIVIICLAAIFAPLITKFSFEEQDINRILLAPNSTNWFGTDGLGRDVFSRLIYGARVSMAIGILTSLVSLVLGSIYGSISGYAGGKVDSMMMRAVDILYSIPPVPMLILVKVVFDSFLKIENTQFKSTLSLLIGISIVSWVALARLVRAQVLQTKQMLYIESARALGVKSYSIIWKHIFPNILGPIIVTLTFQIPSNILWESFVSFIGLGLQPPYSSWGVLASEGWRSLRTYPHLIIFPGIALFVTTLAFNILGDGLRDALDPKSKA